MHKVQRIRLEIEREEDGRFLASVPDLPGVMAYGATAADACRRVNSIALQIFAETNDHGEEPLGAV